MSAAVGRRGPFAEEARRRLNESQPKNLHVAVSGDVLQIWRNFFYFVQ